MRNLFVQLFTRDPLISAEAGTDLMALLNEYIPAALPYTWDNHDLTARPWPAGDLGQAWNQADIFWEAKSPETAKGAAFKRTYPSDTHGVVSLELDPKAVSIEKVVKFIKDLTVKLHGDYGFVHALPADDTSAAPNAFLHMAPQDLAKCLPDLWWGSILGAPYIELIGEERIRTAPAHTVSRVADRAYWLQVSAQPPFANEGLDDDDFDDAHADALRLHLGDALFWRVGRTSFRVPKFLPPTR